MVFYILRNVDLDGLDYEIMVTTLESKKKGAIFLLDSRTREARDKRRHEIRSDFFLGVITDILHCMVCMLD